MKGGTTKFPLTTGAGPRCDKDGGGPAEGMRTMGRLGSTTGKPILPIRDMIESAGDLTPSLMVEAPMDDFRLMATLGVYTLP